MRARRRKQGKGEGRPKEGFCERCGGLFKQKKVGAPRRFCDRHRGYTPVERAPLHKPCKRCGKKFAPYHQGDLFCGRTCQRRALKEKAELIREGLRNGPKCLWCGKPIEKERALCGEECCLARGKHMRGLRQGERERERAAEKEGKR